MSWYRGDWASMTVGSAPIFRFTLQNPAKPTGRVEFIWEPAYDYDNKVPTNGWRTETVSFSQVRAQLSEVLTYVHACWNGMLHALHCRQPGQTSSSKLRASAPFSQSVSGSGPGCAQPVHKTVCLTLFGVDLTSMHRASCLSGWTPPRVLTTGPGASIGEQRLDTGFDIV